MDFEKAYKPPKPFWAMSIPELVAYNNKCKRLDEFFSKRKTIKNSTFWRINYKEKRRKTRNRKNRKTRKRKNKKNKAT